MDKILVNTIRKEVQGIICDSQASWVIDTKCSRKGQTYRIMQHSLTELQNRNFNWNPSDEAPATLLSSADFPLSFLNDLEHSGYYPRYVLPALTIKTHFAHTV
jgi:hypothetical protein